VPTSRKTSQSRPLNVSVSVSSRTQNLKVSSRSQQSVGRSRSRSRLGTENQTSRSRLGLGPQGLVYIPAWLYHVLGPHVMIRAVSASWHPRFGTCCHRTVMLVANSSSGALRRGSLCKPTHKWHLWELCLSGTLQILDLIDWLIDSENYRSWWFDVMRAARWCSG